MRPRCTRRLDAHPRPIPARDDLTAGRVPRAAISALPRFRGEAKLSTLVHRIAINKAYEYLRRQSRRPALLVECAFFDELLSAGATPEGQASTREELARVFACLARIKPKKRIALLLRLVDGLSFEEIGELVDASAEAVAKRVQHGQRELDALMARAEREDLPEEAS